MPLPMPNSGEARARFLDRCMANPTARADFPDPDQRFAVCNTQWRNRDKGGLNMDYKELDCADCDLKVSSEDEPGTFTGMGAVFGNRDMMDDVIERGAFKDSLRRFEKQGRLPPLLFSHRTDKPLGRFLEMEENSRGLKVKGRINLNTTLGNDIHALMKDGDVDGLSIGFRVAENGAEFDERRAVRKLTAIDLMEVSVVVLPANERARSGNVKDYSPELVRTEREFENALRDAGFSRSFAAYAASHWHAPAQGDPGGESLQTVVDRIKRNEQLLRTG